MPPKAMPRYPACPASASPHPVPARPTWSPAWPTPSWIRCRSWRSPAAVARKATGTDAFQEADITGVTRSITKYNYLVMNPDELLPILEEAWNLTTDGRPGPVLVNVPKDLLAMHDQAVGRPQSPSYIRHRPPTVKTHAMTDKIYAALASLPEAAAAGRRRLRHLPRAAPTTCKAFRRKPGHPGCHDPDGQRRDRRRPSALPGQPGHARHAAGQYGAGHLRPAAGCRQPFQRPDHRRSGALQRQPDRGRSSMSTSIRPKSARISAPTSKSKTMPPISSKPC